ncbi:HAMP domain-containing sensor histidine kinase [Flavobacterium sp.]|uniref:sensor histidine kinase n=1 Tax=Flavobacterium sp. TaxID=239 RepID=UPI0012146FA9|nr:HAMP domain-containing sensor histidine kinase [Flavobacterium sp.]RZJ69458.1 MAG: HAMP domain-containing histidine kinase [Flavobacterium sp.]
MTLKRKIAINISIAFSILYGLSAVLLYISSASFRKDEFRNRLEDKAFTTTRLLFEIRQIDRQMLKLIDQNTINKLYNEKTLVFDASYKLIYSSIDDATIAWNLNDLKRLKTEKKIFRSVAEKDLVGVFYDFKGTNDYYVLIAAEDKYGHQQLDYLLQILLVSFFLGTAIVWFSTYAFIRKQLKPLDDFQNDITNITANQLHSTLEVSSENDEIAVLTRTFNEMLQRIDNSFNAQKEFTSNASHELRTPVSRLTLQLDSLLRQENHSEETQNYLQNMKADLGQIADLIHSLLLLARMNEQSPSEFGLERIDEIIFDAFSKTQSVYPDFHLNFAISGEQDPDLEIRGIKSLLEIVFLNLFRNAYLYSDDKKVNVRISQSAKGLVAEISNSGQPISQDIIPKIFEPFVRGENSAATQGSGLGLRIAKRILDYHNVSVSYFEFGGIHTFTLLFTTSN